MNGLFIILEALHRFIQLLCHKEREGKICLIHRLNLPFYLCLPGGVAQSLIDLSTRASFCLEEIASVDPVD